MINQDFVYIYHSIESLLVKASKQEEWESDLESVCETYKDDFDKEVLSTQLRVLRANFKDSETITIFNIKDYLASLSSGQLSLISQVQRPMQLLLVMPATNSSSERSFSTLKRT